MKPLILFYSFTGNNRLLAETLAAKLNCPLVEVLERRPRKAFRIAIDLLLKRFPRIHPVALTPDHDHVLVIAPLWNRWIGHPMRSALRGLGPSIGPYSFVSLSGGQREGQVAFVEQQLCDLVGHAPTHHWALYVERVLAEDVKGTPRASDYRMDGETLATAYPEVDDIAQALT